MAESRLTNNSEETTFGKLLEVRANYSIPPFQREYKWKPERLRQLQADLTALEDEEEDAHFMGALLASILDVAVRDRRLAINPAREVKLPRKTKKRRAYLTAAQVELLAAQAQSHGTLVLTLAYTGLRWGEATGLRLNSLDALRRRIRVTENAVAVGSQIIVGTPKTHEHRTVPYPAFLSPMLAHECEGKAREQLVFGTGDTHLKAPKSTTGWFVASVRRAKAIDPHFPKVTIHDLRHTAASLAISAGANPKAVQNMLGHASAAMTLDTYADLFPDDADALADRLDEIRARAVVGDLWGRGSA